MKLFAILTACLMAAGGATYYMSSSDTCPLTGCPLAKTGGCCPTDTAAATPDCCAVPCPACATNCQECCVVCEECCAAGANVTASVPVAATAPAEEECCAACSSPARVATSAVVAGVSLK